VAENEAIPAKVAESEDNDSAPSASPAERLRAAERLAAQALHALGANLYPSEQEPSRATSGS
jgi:hypothetical protein